MNTKKLKTLVSKIDSDSFVSRVVTFLDEILPIEEARRDIILLYLELLILAQLEEIQFSPDTVDGIITLRNASMFEYQNRVSGIACIGSEEKAEILKLHSPELFDDLSEFLKYEIAIAPHRYGDYERLPFRNSRTLPATEKRECLAPFVSVDTVY